MSRLAQKRVEIPVNLPPAKEALPQSDAAVSAELVDFLYRDKARMASYASLFSKGRRVSREESGSTRKLGEGSGSVGYMGTGVGLRGATEHVSGIKNTITPHDQESLDVLSWLQKKGWHDNWEEAPHGALVRARGTLFLYDRHVMEFAEVFLQGGIDEERAKKGKDQNKDMIRSLEFARKIIPKMIVPSAFVLQTADKPSIVGVLKESDLEEPVSASYFKYGETGLSDVNKIGIKEIPGAGILVKFPEHAFTVAARLIAQVLNKLWEPDGVRVTPIAFYRIV
jgi:hypothetical protein